MPCSSTSRGQALRDTHELFVIPAKVGIHSSIEHCAVIVDRTPPSRG